MLKEKIKKYIPHWLLFNFEKIRIKQRNSVKKREKIFKRWIHQGKPVPPPHVVKQKVVEEYKKKFEIDTLIETGTFLGDMVYSQKNNFRKIISIELDDTFFKDASNKFKKYKHIEIIKGDSSKILKGLINNIEKRCLFWLDGHYSAGFTAKGELETPILAELETIMQNNVDHIILIDDARCFTGTNDYPTKEYLHTYVLEKRKNYKMEIMDDIIRFYPDENK